MKKFILSLFVCLLVQYPAYNFLFAESLNNFSSFPDSVKHSKKSLIDTSKANYDTLRVTREAITAPKLKGLLSEKESKKILRRNEYQFNDYRYTGNLFSYLPFGFVRDLGSLGQPNEILIYGQGFNNISFLNDGIDINNRLQNSLDLNQIPSENIDSIEVIPLTRGFLYGSNNNLAAVNFISRDFETSKPYSRIRFSQAPNEEGMFDGIFSSNFSRTLSTFFEISHYSTDPRFANTDYGSWFGATKIRYLLSNQLALIGSYGFSKTNVQLNGGVNADSIKSSVPLNQYEEILFNNIQAPVNYINRYQKTSGNNLSIRLLGSIIENSNTDLAVYYQSNLIEFRQNENISFTNYQHGIPSIVHNNEFKTLGSKLRQEFIIDNLELQSITTFEKSKFNLTRLSKTINENLFSTSARVLFNANINDYTITPSVFAKHLIYNKVNYTGYGADILFNINNSLKFYTGFSVFIKPFRNELEFSSGNPLLDVDKDLQIIEASLTYNDNLINLSAGYFNKNISNQTFAKDTKLQGANIKLDLKFWKFLINTNTNYYFSKSSRNSYLMPEFTSQGGIYYTDVLFDSNLNLKAGLNYSSVGSSVGTFQSFEKLRTLQHSSVLNVKPSFQIDLFVSGQIQKNATVYFIFENLLNKKYFIVPYYPMYEQGLRFGLAWEFFD